MATIRLNKQTKTIKVVNRKENVSLKRLLNNVHLTHTGRRGEKGEKGDKGNKGDTGYSTMVRQLHNNDPNVARPNALYVEWMGSVAPNNATVVDTWILVPAL